MQWLVGPSLTAAPVHSVVTIPGKYGTIPAILVEFAIAFITMTMVLFTSVHNTLKHYTRLMAGCLVCMYVILAGPVSGFGMNPARSFAAAVPAHIYTAFWIYMLVPVAGMLCASVIFKKYTGSAQVPAESSVKKFNRLF
jgi:aquaporin Z